ncbi:lycopene cyclase family protein [Rhodococcoides fascians]|uniref:lycopene cyclase family protein n=1 Tax=Rhodococcoides fascians TaxID=1828 RepID=UPI000569E28F|nr:MULTISPECIES: lycopene cyclase family protein [Rhodococcus]OZE94468.1 lycopene cyclase [Rhodococcus sp. 15-1189-1-1a]OZF09551.1 lycopene cyclase [Rhodococcus sp. 14-2686-1-2]
MNASRSADVVVVGLGPAGRALSARASAAGMTVIAVDPHPDRTWTPTYSAWSDELPGWLSPDVVATRTSSPTVFTTARRSIERPYCVLDTAALQRSLRSDAVQEVQAHAESVRAHSVTLADGTLLGAGTVVDARGTIGEIGLAEQTAFGIMVPRDVAAPALDGVDAWFMDWRRDNDAAPTDVPSFLYAVSTDPETVLLEETCLVGRPALSFAVLEERLRTRLRNRGVVVSGAEPVERVRFPVQPPPANGAERGVVRFGARSSMMHPATGYSVAASLTAADEVVDYIRRGERVGSLSIWAVQKLRNLGLRTALGLQPELVPHFFASFFDLPVALQRAYLSGRADPKGTALAMTRMFPTLPTEARIAIARTVAGR